VTIVAGVAVALLVVAIGGWCSPRIALSRLDTATASSGAGDRRRRRVRPLARPPRSASPTEAAAWCDDAARALRAGSSLASVIADATTGHPAMATVLDPVAAALARGRSLSDALRRSIGDPSTPAGLVVAVLTSCAELGGPAASPLERVGIALRTRSAIAEEQLAHSAQARLSAKVMTLVPVGLLLLLAATEATVRTAITTPAGAAAISAGAVLNVAGWWWMRRIIGAAT
jgi:tight adherence protein B